VAQIHALSDKGVRIFDHSCRNQQCQPAWKQADGALTMLTFRESILIFGTTILACASVGLLAVRLSNRMLKGLGWLGGSFASAGAGAMLFFFDDRLSLFFGTILADQLVLLSFVLLHVAMLELMESESLFPSFGSILLLIQLCVSGISMIEPRTTGLRIALMGFMIAAQTGQTSFQLFRKGKRIIKTPAWFCAFLLLAFAMLNTARALAVTLGIRHHPQVFYRMEVVTFGVFISVGLGVAFSFFWMTTTMLSTGLERIATTDPLTRLYNRRVFLLWCDKELAVSQRTGTPFSLLMMDIDHFKQINDTYGHETGDTALCTAVERMQSSIRGIDVLARWGGEEFSAVLPNANPEAALVVAERVRANVERILLPAHRIGEGLKAPMIRLTVSVGVATWNGPEDTVQEMLRRADASLYQAKAAGRNRVQAEPEMRLASA
jgi:diguanylate cyclase (GGDEF)-like protein